MISMSSHALCRYFISVILFNFRSCFKNKSCKQHSLCRWFDAFIQTSVIGRSFPIQVHLQLKRDDQTNEQNGERIMK